MCARFLSSPAEVAVRRRRYEEADGGTGQGVRPTAEGTSGAPGDVEPETLQDNDVSGHSLPRAQTFRLINGKLSRGSCNSFSLHHLLKI